MVVAQQHKKIYTPASDDYIVYMKVYTGPIFVSYLSKVKRLTKSNYRIGPSLNGTVADHEIEMNSAWVERLACHIWPESDTNILYGDHIHMTQLNSTNLELIQFREIEYIIDAGGVSRTSTGAFTIRMR